jgi:hypothetical protein
MVSAEVVRDRMTERPIAFVRKFKPDVTIRQGEKQIQASKAEQLFSGDTLRTDDSGFALVQFMDNSIAKVKPNSQLIVYGEVNSKQNASARIALELGEIFLNVTERTTTNFEVATGTSVASVKGTRFGARYDSYFWVVEGVVGLLSNRSGQAVDLTKRMYGLVNDDGSIETGMLSDAEINNLNSEYERLEANLQPKSIILRFRDQNGRLREIELKYFENE